MVVITFCLLMCAMNCRWFCAINQCSVCAAIRSDKVCTEGSLGPHDATTSSPLRPRHKTCSGETTMACVYLAVYIFYSLPWFLLRIVGVANVSSKAALAILGGNISHGSYPLLLKYGICDDGREPFSRASRGE